MFRFPLILKLFVLLTVGSLLPRTASADIGPEFLESFVYSGTNSLSKITNTVTQACLEGNRIAYEMCLRIRDAVGKAELDNPTPDRREKTSQLYEDTERDWFAMIEKKANKGDPFFLVVLGGIYFDGEAFIPKDTAKGIKLWEQAAQKKSELGNYYLGLVFHDGLSAPVDYAKALQYYRQAAELGSSSALCNLGLMYNAGEGCSKDFTKAMECFDKAARMNHAWAQYNLGVCYCYGTENFPQNKELGVKWMRAAAANGHRFAKEYLNNFVDQTPLKRTLPMVIENKQSAVVSTLIAFDAIKTTIQQPTIAILCLTDMYDLQAGLYDYEAAAFLNNYSQTLNSFLKGIRSFPKTPSPNSPALSADKVKIFIVECLDDARARARELNKEYHATSNTDAIPILYVFYKERFQKTYTWIDDPDSIGSELKSVVESLLTQGPP